MLPNGNFNRSRGSVLVENTTAFDTFIHLICCRASDSEIFKASLLQVLEPGMVIFIENYFKNGAEKQTVASRYHVLLSLYNVGIVNKMKVMNCQSTVTEVLMQMWQGICSKSSNPCHCNVVFNIDEIPDQKNECEKNRELKDLIFVDAKNKKMRPNDIAQVIIINEKVFILYAIVEQIQSKTEHFVADIRRSNFQWYRFDNRA